MRHRALVGIISILGVAALFVLFAALASSLSPPDSAYAQSNTPPSFPSEAPTPDVDENTPSYENIGDPVTATDGDNDTLTYSLENAGVSHFRIDSDTGQLQTGAPLDYETQSSYTVTVIATDPAGATGRITVTITVNDVNEPGTVSLSWKQPQVGTVLTATLTDPDGDISGITWQWAKSDSGSKNSNYTDISGETASTYTPVAADVGKYIRATASYTDGEGAGKSAEATSYQPARAVPSDNQAPVFDMDNSAGYGCPEDINADFCLYAHKNTPVGAEIYNPARATDPDRNDEIRYSLEGADANSFGIVPSNGYLVTKTPLNNAGYRRYAVTLKATDSSGASDTVTMTIRLSGGRWNPVVTGPERITYPENGTWRLAKYTAEVPDGPTHGWLINVEPGGGEGDFFHIDYDGVLTFRQPPDYEDSADDGGNHEYFFFILAYDGNPPSGQRPGSTFYPVHVIVTNVDEVLEINGPTAVDYAEGRTDAVASYTVTGNEGPVSWELSGDDSEHFDISSGGELTFKTPPDYDNPEDADGDNAYLLSITVTDGTETKVEPVRVRVTDTNAPPAFAAATDTRTIAENTEARENIGDAITATDPDSGDTLTYTWGGADASSFDVLSYSGQVQTLAPLDYETRNSYSITVSVSDGKDADGNADDAVDVTINVTINVTDANDPPAFAAATATRTIAENTEAGENIGDAITATDQDSGDTLTYSLVVADTAFFDLVETTGQLQTKAALDYEDKNSYTVTVSVRDSKDAAGATDTATDGTITVTISVKNVDEPGTVTLLPAQPQVDTPLTASLSDPDGAPSAISWQWARADSATGTFADISGATSASYTPVNDDAEKYLLATASYTDPQGSGKSAAGVSGNAVQADSLQSRVETNAAPEFPSTETGARSVAENTAAGENIGAPVTATDPDTGDTLTYTLSGTDAASFDIVTTSGQLLTKDALNREAKDSHTVIVSVRDSKNASGNADTATDDTIDVTITVTNEDEAPVIVGESSKDYAENDTAEVATYSATDPDNGTIIWDLSGTDARVFFISATGVLTFKTSPDFEDPKDADTNNEYQVTVEATDGTNPVSLNVIVTVTNEDEDGTVTLSSVQPQVSTVLTATLSDPDVVSGNPTWQWAKADSAEGSFTTISTATTSSYTPVADDVDKYLQVTASYTDGEGSGKSAEAVSTNATQAAPEDRITNTPPAFGKDILTRHIPENTEAGQAIGAPVTATDSGDTLTYSLDVTGSASFDIDEQITGQLQTKAALDHETTPSYTVIVTATDPSNATDTIAVTITVTDVNEAPEFPTETGARSVAENTAAGQPIGSPVAATDPDTNDTLTYSLSGTDAASFDINDQTGQISVGTDTALDYETRKSYTVTVSVRDSKNASGNADTATDDTIDVTITVTNEDDRITTNSNNNDKGDSDDLPGVLDPRQSVISVSPPANRAPVFTEGASTERSVAEHTDRAIYIGEPVTATDADGDQLTYSLGSVVDGKSFAIDEVSGQLITRVPLDFETKPSYTVVVGVSDGRGASDAIVVTINLTDLQEVPITNPRTQAVGKVRPDAETTIETPDGAASVTFPVGSRENSYQVRVDSDASSCGGELPEGALRVSLTVEYFDNWGIQEYDVVLERPATVRLRLNAAELGGVDKVLAAHRRGGFSIYSHSGVAGEWSKVEFMLEDNDQGMITLTARGLRRLNCFAATTDAAAFVPVAQPVTENPTPEPTPRPTDQPTPEVEATPAPTPTAAPWEMTFIPRPLPEIVPYVPEEYRSPLPAIGLVNEDDESDTPETAFASYTGAIREPPVWAIAMMIAGATLTASGSGLYLLARRRRERRWR